MIGNRLVIGMLTSKTLCLTLLMPSQAWTMVPRTPVRAPASTTNSHLLTYAGVSFCETTGAQSDEDRVQIVQDWPSVNTMIGTKEKVPSEIAYTDSKVLWGGTIPAHTPRHMWTKLELDGLKIGEAEKIRVELASLILEGSFRPRHPVNVIADFLAEIKNHLIVNLDRQYGSDLWRTLPTTLVVTVPAVWSDVAKDRTMHAVDQAGFNSSCFPQLCNVVTTTEPEAASIYTINTLKGTVQDNDLEVGDCFVVCDMGGGTVDLISYRVAGTSPTQVDEATVGTGDQCGGSFVDRAFFAWLQKKLGNVDFIRMAGCHAADLNRTSLPPKMGKLLRDFTLTAKSGFSGVEEYYIQLPSPLKTVDDIDRDISDGEIYIQA
jgi:hypothetical protein